VIAVVRRSDTSCRDTDAVFEHRRCEPRDLVFDAADRQAEKSTDGKLLQSCMK
jgi:hypothetical protein